jgi:nitroreductase
MDIIKAINSRRSIRKYTAAPVDDETIIAILKAGMYAPSAMNKQPWEFIVFNDEKKIRELIKVHPSSKMLAGAARAILVCCDMNRVHDPGYMPVDCSAAVQNILLAAHGLGLGACWVGIHPRQERKDLMTKLFSLPGNIEPFAVISLGHPDETKETPERFYPGKIRWESGS